MTLPTTTIVLRNVKGSPLSNTEMDNNLDSLNKNKLDYYTAAQIPTTDVGSTIFVQGIGAMDWNATTSRYEMTQREYGRCYLAYTSTTQVTLRPYDGNGVFFDGFQYRIPVGGVVGTPSGLTPATNYNVYLVGNKSTGALSLEFSTTAHTSASDGQRYKSGDSTRLLVGKIRWSSAGTLVQDASTLSVLSWFNRQSRFVASSLTSSTFANTANTGISNIIAFLSWGDQWMGNIWGYGSVPSPAVTQYVSPYLNSVAQAQAFANGASAGSLAFGLGGSVVMVAPEGWNLFQLFGFISSAVNTTITVNFSATGTG